METHQIEKFKQSKEWQLAAIIVRESILDCLENIEDGGVEQGVKRALSFLSSGSDKDWILDKLVEKGLSTAVSEGVIIIDPEWNDDPAKILEGNSINRDLFRGGLIYCFNEFLEMDLDNRDLFIGGLLLKHSEDTAVRLEMGCD